MAPNHPFLIKMNFLCKKGSKIQFGSLSNRLRQVVQYYDNGIALLFFPETLLVLSKRVKVTTFPKMYK